MFARNQVARAVSGAAFVALAATSLSLAAAEMPTGGPPAEYTAFLRMKAEDVMHAMDKTGRGKVSKAEFMKFHEDMFNQMDRNKDGVLSKDEFMGEKTVK